jgi:Bacterial extracellular solute-binding protein
MSADPNRRRFLTVPAAAAMRAESRRRPGERSMRLDTVARRHFLKASATTMAVAAGALAVGGRAPACAQGTRIHLLQWSHFVPAADTLFEAQAKEFGKQAGVEIAIERINQNDIQARTTAAVQSGSGPDIIVINNNYPHLYQESVADVSDVAEEIGAKQGGWWDYAKVNCFAGNRWVAVPYFIISWAVTYREDWFKEAGFEYFEVMDTFGIPGTKVYRDNPLWRKDPRTAVFPETLQAARPVGYAGPPGRKATEALSKFIMVDMYAKTLQGMRAEDAVKWAEGELKRIYES